MSRRRFRLEAQLQLAEAPNGAPLFNELAECSRHERLPINIAGDIMRVAARYFAYLRGNCPTSSICPRLEPRQLQGELPCPTTRLPA